MVTIAKFKNLVFDLQDSTRHNKLLKLILYSWGVDKPLIIIIKTTSKPQYDNVETNQETCIV